jgi:glycosyltransferase involved in cell wall biosynthesis
MSILVITPTTGAPEVADAIKSVKEQTVPVDHLLVCDGDNFTSEVESVVKLNKQERLRAVYLPFNTGSNGFYGHRIMAGFSHLINHEYVLFLDQDNMYENNHVESLVSLIKSKNLDWSYSLRSIVDKNGTFICNDNCESLGKWPAWVGQDVHLVDSSCYCFKVEFIRQIGHIWDYGWGADRRFFMIAKNFRPDSFDCTGLHTLRYRLGGNEGSVKKEFFEQGNNVMRSRYNTKEGYPWRKQSL